MFDYVEGFDSDDILGDVEISEEVKINLLALNRGSKACVGSLVPEEGKVFISQDVTSAEPNIILNMSQDATLYEVLYGMKDKRPYWNNNGLLMTDSLYISTMSKTNLIKRFLTEKFIEDYFRDSETVKTEREFKKVYKVCKISVLALTYGCSVGNPRKQNGLYNILKLANHELPLNEVKEIYNSYWNALPDVARFRDNVTAFAEKCKKENKPFFNYGGFILPSKQPHKAFNYSIQSFLSSWVRKLLHTMEKEGVFNKDCRLVCVVHDEIVVEVTKGKEEDYRTKVFKAMDDTNEFFNLKYPLQLGFNVGENFYDIH